MIRVLLTEEHGRVLTVTRHDGPKLPDGRARPILRLVVEGPDGRRQSADVVVRASDAGLASDIAKVIQAALVAPEGE